MPKNQARNAAAKRAKAVAPVVQAAIEAAVQAAPEEPTATYIVLHPVSHDNEPYKRGEQIDLTDDQAEALLALNVIAAYTEPSSEEAK
jgi:hypothetical protein